MKKAAYLVDVGFVVGNNEILLRIMTAIVVFSPSVVMDTSSNPFDALAYTPVWGDGSNEWSAPSSLPTITRGCYHRSYCCILMEDDVNPYQGG